MQWCGTICDTATPIADGMVVAGHIRIVMRRPIFVTEDFLRQPMLNQ